MVLAALPVILTFVALIDPRAQPIALPAILLAGVLLAREVRNHRPIARHVTALMLAASFGITGWSEPRWCCDATAYYIYARSAAFDHDLDLRNDWAGFGFDAPELTSTGLAMDAAPVGPAILWAPFVLMAHIYVRVARALDLGAWAADGYSQPYLRACAAGTVTAVVAGLVALFRACARFHSTAVAATAVVFGCLTSVLPYYVFVAPSTSHGPVFAASALFLALWMEMDERPTARGLIGLGAMLGAVSLLRWQAVVLGLMFVPLFAKAWRDKAAGWRWTLAPILASMVVMLPQAYAFWILFGSPLAVPTRFHGMDWSSPHLVDVLFSADRGLFTWTPAMAIGCLGFVLLAHRRPSFAWSAMAVFLATAWVNGGVAVWSGGDAYGARRFDLLIPLWVVGFAAVLETAMRVTKSHPLLAPSAGLSLFVLWNLGLMQLHRNYVFTDAAPLEEVAARQASFLRWTMEDWLGKVAGPRGRNFGYRAFVGRYFYVNTGFDGKIDLSLQNVKYLAGSWSDRTEQPDSGPVRFAARSGSCIKVPLDRSFALPVVVSARSVVEGQEVTLLANGHAVSGRGLPMEWTDLRFQVPAVFVNPGENLFCLAFTRARPNQRAAAVARFQLP